MNAAEMQALVETVSYPDYVFAITEDSRGEIYLQASYVEPDIISGEPERQYTRRWLLSPAMVKSEIIQTVFKCVLTSAEHRVREGFLYQGERIFGPHFDVDGLYDLCKAKRLDYRGRKHRSETATTEFKKYRRSQIAELRTFEPGEILPDSVSISAADREAGSPKTGDMIARNPVNHNDQWLVAAEYFAANFEPLEGKQ